MTRAFPMTLSTGTVRMSGRPCIQARWLCRNIPQCASPVRPNGRLSPQPSPTAALVHLHRAELLPRHGYNNTNRLVGHHRRRVEVRLVELSYSFYFFPSNREARAGNDIRPSFRPRESITLTRVVLVGGTSRRTKARSAPSARGESSSGSLVSDVPVWRALEHDHVARLRRTEPEVSFVDHVRCAGARSAVQRGPSTRTDQVRPRDEHVSHDVLQDHRDGDRIAASSQRAALFSFFRRPLCLRPSGPSGSSRLVLDRVRGFGHRISNHVMLAACAARFPRSGPIGSLRPNRKSPFSLIIGLLVAPLRAGSRAWRDARTT